MIQIIGAGAIGCLWLSKLLASQQPCHLVSRSPHPTNTLQVTDLKGVQHSFTISHSQQLLNTTKAEQNSTILVCVKAPQVVTALLMQQVYIRPEQPIILMHNGYGCAEQVAVHFPHNPIICATTANASLLHPITPQKTSLHITETGVGATFLGVFDSQHPVSSSVIKPLQKAMYAVFWSENIIEKCWLKLVINAVINPLTAIHQINNGALQEAYYQVTIKALLIEIVNIANADNLHFTLEELNNTVAQVIQATAENYSSMNRDVFYQRPTEIDYINGYLLSRAEFHGINAPYLKDCYQQIKALVDHSSIAVNTL